MAEEPCGNQGKESSARREEIFQGSIVKVFSSRPLCSASLRPTCDVPGSRSHSTAPQTAHRSRVVLTLGGLRG